jgi:hypothetical protein
VPAEGAGIISIARTLAPACCEGGSVVDWDDCFAVSCPWCEAYFCGFCCPRTLAAAQRMASSAQPPPTGTSRVEAAAARRRLFTQRLDDAFRPFQQGGDPGFVAS